MKFIEKKFYTFTELETRWECTAVDLIQSVIDRELVPSLYIPGGNYLLYRFEPCDCGTADSCCSPRQMLDQQVDKLDNEVQHLLTGFRYLILPVRSGACECVFSYFAETPNPGEDDFCYSFWQSMAVDDVLKSGFVMADEVARVEARSSGNPVPDCTDKQLATADLNTQSVRIEPDIDPSDLPEELDAANMAYRAVLNGFDIQTGTFKNKLIEFLSTNYSHLGNEALGRIATVANPDKTRGRKKRHTK